MVPTFPHRLLTFVSALAILLASATGLAQGNETIQPSDRTNQDPDGLPLPPQAPLQPTTEPTTQPTTQPTTEPTPATPQPAVEHPDSNEAVVGVGGQLALSGFGGLQILYQKERYHLDGLISFFDAADTTVSVGGRFFWHAHKSDRADFSIGAGLGLTHINDADLDILHVEAVGQIRFFVAPAVAISATMGVALQTLDGDVVGLGSDLLGGAGISYLFY